MIFLLISDPLNYAIGPQFAPKHSTFIVSIELNKLTISSSNLKLFSMFNII